MLIKYVVTLSFLLLFFSSFSQDTLFFFNKNKVVAKVSEINISDIKYHRFDNLTGPQYTVNKTEINVIKFANGVVDTIELVPQPISNISINQYNSDNKLHVGDRYRIIYNYHTLNEKELKEFISDIPQKTSRDLLLKDFALMKHYKVNQYLLGYSGIGFGVAGYMGAIIFDTSYKRTSSNNYNVFASIAAGAIGVLATQILSRMERNKRYFIKLEIARKYNNL
jgi:hypothetical protein